jgi:cell division protein FtsZ
MKQNEQEEHPDGLEFDDLEPGVEEAAPALPPAQAPSFHRILVAGLGGGGSRSVERMATSWKQGADLMAIDCDQQALDGREGVQRILVGGTVTEGLGSGGDADIGRLAAEDDKDLLRDAVFGMKYIVPVVCLGGGMGTGAAPVLAQIAREEGAVTICFATMPFPFEGEKRMRQAEEGLKLLVGHCDVVVCLPNEKLMPTKSGEVNLLDAFASADDALGVGIRALCEVISSTGVINIDFADIRQAVESSDGLCTYACGVGTGSRRAERAANAALKHPLLAQTESLAHATSIVVNITAGSQLTLVNVQTIMEKIRSAARPGAHLLMGTVMNEDWGNKIGVTLIVPSTEGVRRVVAATAPRAAAETNPGDAGLSAAAKRLKQADLNFDTQDKGRFKNVEPTIHQGQDLDIPTFIRRGLKLSFDR